MNDPAAACLKRAFRLKEHSHIYSSIVMIDGTPINLLFIPVASFRAQFQAMQAIFFFSFAVMTYYTVVTDFDSDKYYAVCLCILSSLLCLRLAQ